MMDWNGVVVHGLSYESSSLLRAATIAASRRNPRGPCSSGIPRQPANAPSTPWRRGIGSLVGGSRPASRLPPASTLEVETRWCARRALRLSARELMSDTGFVKQLKLAVLGALHHSRPRRCQVQRIASNCAGTALGRLQVECVGPQVQLITNAAQIGGSLQVVRRTHTTNTRLPSLTASVDRLSTPRNFKFRILSRPPASGCLVLGALPITVPIPQPTAASTAQQPGCPRSNQP